MNLYELHHILQQFRVSFRAFFSALTDQDFGVILAAPSETLLVVLQKRYGYTRPQAKAAWNEFVLRYVDGSAPADRDELPWAAACTACLARDKLIKQGYFLGWRRVQSKQKMYC